MAPKRRNRSIAAFHLFLCLLLLGCLVDAQFHSNESANSSSSNGKNLSVNFSPSMAVIVIILFTTFFFLCCFSIYVRNRNPGRNNTFPSAAAAAGFMRINRGLDPQIMENFPTLIYSEVKEHKIGKGALECAICINEFEDDETIRLLPQCDHVFHLDCIDAWLGSHVTCPVCRANYTFYSPDRNDEVPSSSVPPESVSPHDASPAEHTAITMDEREEEMRELARIASRVRGNGQRRSKRISKSHSTGHSMMSRGEEGLDRFTLRLPENVRKEFIAAGRLKRSRTFAMTTNMGGAGEASMSKLSKGVGEGSSRRGRTIRLGGSDRRPSFFGRSLSARIFTLSRKFSGIKTAADSRGGGGGGGSKGGGDDYSDEASTAALRRV